MKRARTADTTSGAVAMLMDALQGPPPPPAGVDLRPEDMRHWDGIIATRPSSAWTPHDLEIASLAAMALADVVKLQAQLKKHGSFTKDRFKEVKASPVVAVLDTTTRRMLSLMRNLGLATDPENVLKRTEAFQKTKLLARQIADEPLLAQ